MLKIKNTYANWVEKSDIPFVVQQLPSKIDSVFQYALITGIDSMWGKLETIADIREIFEQRHIPYQIVIGGAILLDYKIFKEFSQSDNISFNGFDEIWLLENLPTTMMTEELTIFSDIPITEKSHILSSISNWIRPLGCILGLGDGIGLNYVTNDEHIANFIEEIGK